MKNDTCNIIKVFEKKINLLLVDDDKDYLDIVERMFSSPLFNIKKVTSLQPALSTIRKSNDSWHCWIVDIALGKFNEGLTLLKKHREFPFTVVWSGLGSMTAASEAIHLGAMHVFDKKQKYINLFFTEVCKVAALGFILQGKGSRYLPYFLHLKDDYLHNRELWAEKACVSIRQLERVCSTHSILTTKYLLSLYYSLYFFLLSGTNNNRHILYGINMNGKQIPKEFFLPHIQFVHKNLDKFQQSIAA